MEQRRQTYVEGWTLYPVSMVGHHAQGLAVGVTVLLGSPSAQIAALLWAALYVSYQGLSVPRKMDSPGLDIADFMAGCGAGLAGAIAWPWLKLLA